MAQWVRVGMWVVAGVIGATLLVGWLDSPSSDPAKAYCERVSGTRPTLYESWIEGQRPTLGNFLTYGICLELQKENILHASCDVKTKWYQEKFRHEEEADKIANGDMSIYNIDGPVTSKNDDGTETTVDLRKTITDNNNRQIEIACALGS